MTPEARRAYGREYAQRIRDRRLAEKMRAATRCPKRHGPGVCGGLLETRIGQLGATVIVCPLCERQRAGICRYCSRPVEGQRKKALYCRQHREEIRLKQVRASQERHHEERLQKARDLYWADEARRARNLRKKALWRKANPEKVRAQKRRYVEKHRNDPDSRYMRYHRRYRKRHAAYYRESARRRATTRRRPIPNCKKCGEATGWTPVTQLNPGRPWETCMRCASKDKRKQRRRARAEAAKRIAQDPRFGLRANPARVRPPLRPSPRGPGYERICITPGCDIVVTHRKKKCSRCRRRDVELAAQELAKSAGRGRRTDLERVA